MISASSPISLVIMVITGAQLVAPYVEEEVSWAIKYHQSLRFIPDEDVGYPYPEAYIRYFGEDYKPEPYIYKDAQYARNHKWYMSARQICINDVYSFDPNIKVNLEDFSRYNRQKLA